MNHRRLTRDYEAESHRSEAVIHVAMIDLIGRRLTRESALNWRDTRRAPSHGAPRHFWVLALSWTAVTSDAYGMTTICTSSS